MTCCCKQALSISFGGLKAVQDVSLAVPAGSISALVGPNGAGKTTLFGLLSGFLRPDQGKVLFDGRDITGMAPQRAARLGMARTFQIVQPFGAQTVRENIAVGAHLRLPGRADALAAAEAIARRVNLGAQLDKPAADLTVCGRKRLELARALATRPRLLLLDEVLAGLNPAEIDEMIPVVRQLAADGVTVLMIEHVMRAVMSLAAQVWCWRRPAHRPGHAGAGDARRRWWKPTWGMRPRAWPGRAARTGGGGTMSGLLEVQGLRAGYGRTEVLRGVDLSVGQGEIVVLLGSNGAGKSTLNNTLCGLLRPWGGRVRFGSSDLTGRHYRDVVRAGLIQVPEGRRVFPNLSVRENLELGSYARARARRPIWNRCWTPFPGCASAWASWPAPYPAANSECWPSARA